MDKVTRGAWIVHHNQKLRAFQSPGRFTAVVAAGQCGVLLSALSAEQEVVLDMDRVRTLAQANAINPYTELPGLLSNLESANLVDVVENSVAVLGLNTRSVLGHTSALMDRFNPNPAEIAAIEIAEITSDQPIELKELSSKISDQYRFNRNKTKGFFEEIKEYGFVDFERVDDEHTLLFNGNLFRKTDLSKVARILESLSESDAQKIRSFSEMLRTLPCIDIETARLELGDELLKKSISIGLFDLNEVSNKQEIIQYVTRKSSFSKYGDALIEDALDLAKAFVTSITYGMTRSAYARGQIRMVERLLQSLIRGEPVGPVDAIGEDYRVLELKGVVKVYQGSKKGRTGWMMRLLKKDVGEMALSVVQQGDASPEFLTALPGAPVTRYLGPEPLREGIRRRPNQHVNIDDMLFSLRTGRIY